MPMNVPRELPMLEKSASPEDPAMILERIYFYYAVYLGFYMNNPAFTEEQSYAALDSLRHARNDLTELLGDDESRYLLSAMFARTYYGEQMLSNPTFAPLLAAAVNSPILLGKRLQHFTGGLVQQQYGFMEYRRTEGRPDRFRIRSEECQGGFAVPDPQERFGGHLESPVALPRRQRAPHRRPGTSHRPRGPTGGSSVRAGRFGGL